LYEQVFFSGRKWLVSVFCILGITLSGCATFSSFAPPSADSLQAWQARTPQLMQLQTWKFVGRVVVKAGGDSWSGSIVWAQQLDAYQIDFKTPLGQSMLQLQGRAGSAVLRLANDKQYQANDVEKLMYSQLGWDLPIKTLMSWVIGKPAPVTEYEFKLDDSGRLKELKQGDWDVHYKRYAAINKLDLPKVLFLDGEEVNIRLVIDKWML